MKYLAYPAYTATGPNGASFPAPWPVQRLRFHSQSNPVRSEVAHLAPETLVTFVPMEAVGEWGGMDTSAEREVGDVSNGYTYFANGDVVIAKITPCFENGKGAIAQGLSNGVAFGTTELHVIRPNESLSNRWVFYLTMSHVFRKWGEAEMFGAGGQKRVPEEFIRNLRLGIPSLDEQERIADFLDWRTAQIDALIAKKHALVERLREQRAALIERTITCGVHGNRDAHVSPYHWQRMRLRFLAPVIEQGWSPQCENSPAEDDAWGVTKVGCVNGDQFDPSENKALPEDVPPLTELELLPGDVLISRANTKELVGSAAVVPEDVRPKLLLCDKLFRLRLVPGVLPQYITYALRSPTARWHYEQRATGASSSMQNIGQETLKELPVLLPPLLEQQEICEYIASKTKGIDKVVDKATNAITRLTEYRSALITAAVTGQIDVRAVQVPAPV